MTFTGGVYYHWSLHVAAGLLLVVITWPLDISSDNHHGIRVGGYCLFRPVYVSSCDINQSPAPDHKVVTLGLITSTKTRGKGYWKLNVSILEDNEYLDMITNVIKNTIQQYKNTISKCVLWDYLKKLIKEHSIKFCIDKAKCQKDKIGDLEKRLDQLDKNIQINNDRNLLEERKQMKQELDLMYHAKSKGYQVRSRARWIEEGERSTSYFCGLEKTRQSGNCIDCIKDKLKISKTTDQEILQVAHEFYDDLYSSRNISDDEVNAYLVTVHPDSVLTELQKDSCEGAVTYDECTSAVLKMKNNKSPGLDGICIEFYKKLWPIIGELVVSVFNESFTTGTLPSSLRTAVMSLMFKKGDEEDMSNYRPISLTNVDYRILAFVLANRMQTVISSVINSDQTGYIKCRYMGQNIRLFQDVFDDYKENDKLGILLTLDFMKAFDSLEWKFMFKVMEIFNFGNMFISWIRLLYNNPISYIKNNGYLSENINISRGIRQGCPVSALLFILAVEVLSIKIRTSTNIKGIQIGNINKVVKISQYADDTIVYLNDKDELYTVLNILSHFGNVAGTTLNVKKCEGLYLGQSEKDINFKDMFGIKWTRSIRCLGIYIGFDYKQQYIKNWSEKVDMISKCLKMWESRDLTLFGKVHVIKTLALPKIILPATILPVPAEIITELNSIFFKFLWGKVERVKRIKMIQSECVGGVNMIDLETLFDSFKAAWIPRMIKADAECDTWVQIPHSIFSRFGGLDVVKDFKFVNSSEIIEFKQIPLFYKQVITCYSKAFRINYDTFTNNILEQPIWCNEYITIRKKGKKNVLLLRNWIRSGIRKVKDLIFVNGILDRQVCNKIDVKRNIILEYACVRKALSPYAPCIIAALNQRSDLLLSHSKYEYIKSKLYYRNFLKDKVSDITVMSRFLQPYCVRNETEEKEIFVRRVSSEKEKKMKEFNFKLLHGILPCGVNLVKWKIRDSSQCDVCDKEQTIIHLLFECKYVEKLWRTVDRTIGWSVQSDNIICGSTMWFSPDVHSENTIITIVCFLIYKDWLLHSLDNRKRPPLLNENLFKFELELRQIIYQKCKMQENAQCILRILAEF